MKPRAQLRRVRIVSMDPIGRRPGDLVHLRREGCSSALCYTKPNGYASKFETIDEGTLQPVTCKKCLDRYMELENKTS